MLGPIRPVRGLLIFLLLGAGAGACGGTITGNTGSTGGGTGGGTGTGGGSGGSGCPAQQPTPGAACSPAGLMCHYGGAGCGPSAQCSANGTWSIIVPPCPPMEPCSALTTAPDCATVSTCRWLVPGCVMPPPFAAGCFDAQDCVPGTVCASGQSCVTVDTDPCWDSNCTTCSGGKADVCYGPG